MDRFISIQCENKLLLMTISGEPSMQQLSLAWKDIIDEYNANVGDFKFDDVGYFTRLRNSYQLRYNIIELIISRLLMQYDQQIWNELISIHTYWFMMSDINVEDRQIYEEALQQAYEQNKRFLHDIKELQKQLDEWITNKEKENDPTDKKYFARMFAVLSKENGYQVNRKETTVSDYVEMILILKQKVEQQTQNSQRA